MRLAITGSTGLVGSEVVTVLSAAGHEVVRLVRRVPAPGEKAVRWDPVKREVDAAGVEGFDAVVHLAGENIASGRWNVARKAAIRDSRVNGTRFLCEILAGLARPPKTLVCASAIGYYGDRGADVLSEESLPERDFSPRSAGSGRRPPSRPRGRGSALWCCGSGWCYRRRGGRSRGCSLCSGRGSGV